MSCTRYINLLMPELIVESNGRSKSSIGVDAESKDKKEPTMVLSFSNKNNVYNTHIVVHEFGHALGMKHEHQRSKFLSIAKKFLDVEKMRKDSRLLNASIDREYLGVDPDTTGSLEYDPDSVMHYW